MQPARGDRRPCSSSGCGGMMQFGRESDNGGGRTQWSASSASTSHDATGWVCNRDPDHFRKDA